jgi:cysteinyl-tRNA synthetase
VLGLLGLAAAAPATACSGDGRSPSTADGAGTPSAAGSGGTEPGVGAMGAASRGPSARAPSPTSGDRTPAWTQISSWIYQLQGYENDALKAIARAPQRLAVIDLARDAKSDFFRADEIAAVRASGKRVLAYFEIGSIENFRPEHAKVVGAGLALNRWPDWPDEFFVRYWDERWWTLAVKPRLDRALKAGFDGVYLDTPLAYEEIDLGLVPGQSRDGLGRLMSALIVRISKYAKQHRHDFGIFPQNSPELRRYPGYTGAIDGIGMEELFFLATDQPCTQDWCGENLADTRALRDAGKLVLAVDYATKPANVRAACVRYAAERFAGCVTVRELDRVNAPCS